MRRESSRFCGFKDRPLDGLMGLDR
jgi:hypothetical protein